MWFDCEGEIDAPSEVEDIKHALVVADEDCGLGLEVLLAFNYEPDVYCPTGKHVECAGDDKEHV